MAIILIRCASLKLTTYDRKGFIDKKWKGKRVCIKIKRKWIVSMVLKFKLEWNELTSANRQNSHNLRNLHKKNARLISTIQLFVTIFQMSYKLDKKR